tara:strand:+ start:12193 stop:12777 length:585 start_codon:yes stop_codon:yes gene_type:complete
MSSSLRIIVADDEPLLVEELSFFLDKLGHQVVGTASSGKELVDLCAQLQPDLVVTDIKMPELDGLEAAKLVRGSSHPVPFVVVTAYPDKEFLHRAADQHVMAYLVKPIREEDLRATIYLAMQRFHELQFLLRETNDLKRSLEERKLVERAKGILMKRATLSEADAFRRLQELASTKHQKMAEIAKTVIAADEFF